MKSTLIYRGIRYYIRKVKEFVVTCFFSVFYKEDYDKLLSLKNKHKGEPCILIGGGPSLNKMNLESFKDYVTIANNGFFFFFFFLSWSPTYYTVEDPLPAEDNKFEINNLKNTTKIIPYDLKKYIKKDQNTIYTNFRRSYLRPTRKNFPKFSYDFNDMSYWGGTVMYFNIQLAAYLGCNPIYLVGVDLSYSVPESVIKNGAVLKSTEEDTNHFDPRYFGKGKRWHLPEVARMQHCFTKAYKELDKKGIKLINAGVDSKLKIIPKESIL